MSGPSVEREPSHLLSQHFGDVRGVRDSRRTALGDAPKTHPKNYPIGLISLHSVLHELEVRLATVPASSKVRAIPRRNLGL